MSKELHVVTGAFGFSGKYIAKRLLQNGYKVRTLTNSFNPSNPFGDKIKIYPLNFNNIEKLIESLKGASVLYNTYWVRFNYKNFTYSLAVENTRKLFYAAKEAGVRRIVHVSITNPSENVELEYFRGKANLEQALIQSDISYAILRPALLFGNEGILINNIAWLLRKFPIFCIFGNGNYKLRPIYIVDMAELAVEQGKNTENIIIDAIGPETFTYRDLVREINKILGKERFVISINDNIAYFLSWIIGKIVGDVLITRDEIKGLKSNLLYVNSSHTGNTRLTDWLKENSSTIGMHYISELACRKMRNG